MALAAQQSQMRILRPACHLGEAMQTASAECGLRTTLSESKLTEMFALLCHLACVRPRPGVSSWLCRQLPS